MIKSPTFGNFVRRKCAEMFLESETKLSFVCGACLFKSFDYEDFVLHLRNAHLPEAYAEDKRCPGYESDDEAVPIADTTYSDSSSEWDEKPLAVYAIKKMFVEPAAQEVEIQFEHGVERERESSSSEWNWEEEPLPEKVVEKPKVKKVRKPRNPKEKNTYKRRKEKPSITHSCSHCSKPYKCKRSLANHITKHHNADSPLMFICRFCGKQTLSRRALINHEESHNTERKYICDFEGCGRGYVSARNLYDHKRSIHEAPKTYVCVICGGKVRSKASLDVHMRTHTGERPYVCKVCGKSFASRQVLKEHAPMHSTERPHACKVCGKTFSRSKALYHHKFLHEGKKFACKVCGQAFAQMSGLSNHMRRHREEMERQKNGGSELKN